MSRGLSSKNVNLTRFQEYFLLKCLVLLTNYPFVRGFVFHGLAAAVILEAI